MSTSDYIYVAVCMVSVLVFWELGKATGELFMSGKAYTCTIENIEGTFTADHRQVISIRPMIRVTRGDRVFYWNRDRVVSCEVDEQ